MKAKKETGKYFTGRKYEKVSGSQIYELSIQKKEQENLLKALIKTLTNNDSMRRQKHPFNLFKIKRKRTELFQREGRCLDALQKLLLFSPRI